MIAKGAKYNTHIAKMPVLVFGEDEEVPKTMQADVRFTHDGDGETMSFTVDGKTVVLFWEELDSLIREARASFVEVKR